MISYSYWAALIMGRSAENLGIGRQRQAAKMDRVLHCPARGDEGEVVYAALPREAKGLLRAPAA